MRLITLLFLVALVDRVYSAGADTFCREIPVTVTDGQGRELNFDTLQQRVVGLYNGNFGNLAVIGVRPVATLANASMMVAARYFEDSA